MEEIPIGVLLERAGNAADEELHTLPECRWELALHHHIRDSEPAAGLQHPKRFAQHGGFVTAQIDHAVRDDDVDTRVGKWDLLDLALEETDILHPALGAVLF